MPGFWDPRRRPDRPGGHVAPHRDRFLPETDYPPFNFTGADGNPAGFNVDLARALCDEIKISCTVQMRRFETLVDAITSNRGDAIIASMAVTPALRARLDFTDPYYRAPARFVSRRDAVMPEIRPEYLEGKKVGVIAGTSHEAYLKAMFTDAELKSYPNDDALRLALRRSEVDFIFGDAISLAFWINGTDLGRNAARSRAGPLSRAAISARASASPSARATICSRTSLNSPVELEDGASGELVWTHLGREASPLLRYRSGDLGRVWTTPCACGRSSPRIRIDGRRDDMLRVQAVNVYPQAIGAILSEDSRLGRHCVVAVGDPVSPPLQVYVEADPQVDLAGVSERLHAALNARFAVTRLEPGSLPVAEHKTRIVHRTARGDSLPPAVESLMRASAE